MPLSWVSPTLGWESATEVGEIWAKLGAARPQDKVELQDLGGDMDSGSQHPDRRLSGQIGTLDKGCKVVSAIL